LGAGFRVEIDETLTTRLHQPPRWLPGQTSGIPGYPCYRSVEETYATAQSIAADYPGLASWIDMGDSWEKTASSGSAGYDMRVLRLTNSAVPGPKPKLFVMSSVHAREYTPAELATRFAEFLVDRYDSDPDVTWLLDYHEIHLLLQANPDGRKRAETGLSWRKNTNNGYCTNSYLRGADLNRNFGFGWGCCGGSSGFQCSEVFRGPSPGSEPETQAIQNYVRAQFPDQRDEPLSAAAPIHATGVFLDLHSYSELVLWPWGIQKAPAPNGTALQTLGRKFAYFNGYAPHQAFDLYPTDGTTDDFAYGELGLAAYSFELGSTFFQNCSTFENTIVPDNLPALTYAAKVARTPYLTPAGPDIVSAAVAPEPVFSGTMVQLTATVDDTRYNNRNGVEPTQNIAAAEYYVDTPPWITSTPPIGKPMTAADGAFDEKIEAVQASVDISGLSGGRHIIFVRGRDTGGNWGAFQAVFLTIAVAPVAEFTSNSPVPFGYPVIFANLTTGILPIDYAWDFGDNLGRSTVSAPSYTFPSTGTFTVTLVATNSLGSDRVSHPVVVAPGSAMLPLKLYLPVIMGPDKRQPLAPPAPSGSQ
jgi:carboxypeptidase T